MAVPYTTWLSLPGYLPPMASNLKTVAVLLSIIFITHETQECYVDWSHPELEGFKMQTEILPKATEYLDIREDAIM